MGKAGGFIFWGPAQCVFTERMALAGLGEGFRADAAYFD